MMMVMIMKLICYLGGMNRTCHYSGAEDHSKLSHTFSSQKSIGQIIELTNTHRLVEIPAIRNEEIQNLVVDRLVI